MRYRDFGTLGQVSALSLGGGGIGAVWGSTDRAEAVATVHAAIDGGVTMLDLAPTYGPDFEAERVAGEALAARPAPEVLITTKVELPEETVPDRAALMVKSMHDSLRRLGRDHIDLYLLHSQLRPRDWTGSAPRTLGWDLYQDEVVPVFERLRADGTIRAWGLTGVGHPQTVLDALAAQPAPQAVQVVVNALDISGDMWLYGDDASPRNGDILAAAGAAGVPAVAIRVVAAGSLTASLDRAVDPGSPPAADFDRAAGFRALAADLGENPAVLAHRYALSVPGVATVVLGVKNRAELAEALDAETRGPLSDAELAAIEALRKA